MWRAILKGQLFSIPEQATYCSLYAVNKFMNVVLQQFCFDSRSCSAGPYRTIFFDFLEKSDPAMILHFLAVGAYEGECTCRPK